MASQLLLDQPGSVATTQSGPSAPRLLIESEARSLRERLETFFDRIRITSSLDEEVTTGALTEDFIVLVSGYSTAAVQKAVLMTVSEACGSGLDLTPRTGAGGTGGTSSTETGRLPIHLACDHSAPVDVIRWLLDADVEKRSILAVDAWGDLPIHTACSRGSDGGRSVEVVKLLLDSDAASSSSVAGRGRGYGCGNSGKNTVLTKDNHGMLPLHMACRYSAPAEVVRLLLDADPQKASLLEEGVYKQLPIHVACRCNAPAEVIRLLLENDAEKKSPAKEDDVGRIPFHLCLLHSPRVVYHTDPNSRGRTASSADTDVVRMLLEGMVHGRAERLGLEGWRRSMFGLMKSMATRERDFDTREKLDIVCEVMKEFMEKEFVLQLVIWRASCLGFARKFDTMEDVVKLSATDDDFDEHEYKWERHIKSGAQDIIPGVLSFLENEPVREIIRQFKEFK